MMKVMKKWFGALLTVILACSLTACAGKEDLAVENDFNLQSETEEENEEKEETEGAGEGEADKDNAPALEEQENAADAEDPKEADKEEVGGMPLAVDYKEGVVDASKLFIKNGVAFWGYGQQLCSALLDEDRNLYDFISEGTLNGAINYIALDGNEIYLSTEKGIVCIPMEKSEEGQSQATVINEHALSTSSFQMYEGNIYFAYGKSLYCVPKEGGEEKVLEENIEEFQVTANGVYCLNEKGDLLCLSLDGRERKTLCELDSEGKIFIQGDRAYITTGDDKDYVYVYELEKDTYEKLHFEQDLSPYDPVWVTNECLYYESDDYDVFRYDFQTGTESQVEVAFDLAGYEDGTLENDVLYYVLAEDLYCLHLDDGESLKIGKGEALAAGGNTDAASESSASESPAADNAYNIAENIGVFNSEGQARLESKYFSLYLPADGEWIYQVIDDSTIGIYYGPSYESGAGGHLVTIKAFDWGDNSYEDFPEYTVAGTSEDKKYIAIFPTDVQYDSSQESGYRRMYEYVKRINDNEENAADNPFFCQ